MASLLETWRAKLHLDPRTPHLQLSRAIVLIRQTSTGPRKYKYFFGPYRKITETLPQLTATNRALRQVTAVRRLRPLRCRICPAGMLTNRRAKRAPRPWTEADQRHKIVVARNQS